VGITTKNHLVTRDLDALTELAAFECVQVFISLTTLDQHLTQINGARTSVPRDRLRAIRELSAAGVPVGVLAAPVIPGLTEHEMPAILAAGREAGAIFAGFTPLRLPFAVKEIFADWLDRHLPEAQGEDSQPDSGFARGRLNDPNLRSRMRGEGVWAEHLGQTFHVHATRLGLNKEECRLSTRHFPAAGGGATGVVCGRWIGGVAGEARLLARRRASRTCFLRRMSQAMARSESKVRSAANLHSPPQQHGTGRVCECPDALPAGDGHVAGGGFDRHRQGLAVVGEGDDEVRGKQRPAVGVEGDGGEGSGGRRRRFGV